MSITYIRRGEGIVPCLAPTSVARGSHRRGLFHRTVLRSWTPPWSSYECIATRVYRGHPAVSASAKRPAQALPATYENLAAAFPRGVAWERARRHQHARTLVIALGKSSTSRLNCYGAAFSFACLEPREQGPSDERYQVLYMWSDT